MKYFDKYIQLREELWAEFEKLVRTGAKFPELLDVTYPRGQNQDGLSKTTEDDSWFYAAELIANPDYILHIGEDLIVATGEVDFKDTDGKIHHIEPDILDLYWLAQLIDSGI